MMTITDYTGAAGVTILLLAFLLNLMGKLPKDEAGYLLLNAVGAGMACIASILLQYWPFIILEGCWTLVSIAGIIHLLYNRRDQHTNK